MTSPLAAGIHDVEWTAMGESREWTDVKPHDPKGSQRGSLREEFIHERTAINFKIGFDVFEDTVQGTDL
jgi:hypothetical protein